MRSGRNHLLLILSAVMCTSAAPMVHATSAQLRPEILKTKRQETQATSDTTPVQWQNVDLPCLKLNENKGKTLWISGTLPDVLPPQATIYIRSMDVPFQAMVAGKTIYEFGFEDGKPEERFLGFPWHMVSIPEGSAGQQIQFLTEVQKGKSGLCTELMIGPARAFTTTLATDGIDRTLGALFAFLFGIAGIVVMIATKRWRPYLAFSGYSFAIAAWVFSNTSGPAIKLLLIDSPRLWAFLDLAGLYLTPVFLAAFFRQIASGKGLGLLALKWLQWAHLAFALVVLPLGALDVIHLRHTLGYFNAFIPLFLLTLSFESIRRLRKGRLEERTFAVGMVFFLVFAVHDFLVGSGIFIWTRHLAHFGHLSLLTSIAIIVTIELRSRIRERAELSRQAEINSRFMEKVRSAFHDLKTPIASLGNKIDSLENVPRELRDSMKSNLTRMRAILALQFDEKVQTASAGAKNRIDNPPIASLGGTLAVLAEDLSPLASSLGIEWDFSIPKWSFRVFLPMRAVDLLRILTNLVQNAFQAAVLREKHVLVTFTKEMGKVQIVVRDFGPGFTDRAYQAFERGEAYTTKADGNGQGLISTKNLVQAVGGTLTILTDSSGVVATVAISPCDMPAWYFNPNGMNHDEIAVLDDDEEIGSKLAKAFPAVRFQCFTGEADFLSHCRVNPGVFAFVDYSYGGNRTGLQLIQAEGLLDRAVLFTGRGHFDLDLQVKVLELGLKIFPKECLAGSA